MIDCENEADYNELSLFITPLGRLVQQEHCEALLGKRDPKTERAFYITGINDSLTSIAQSFWDIDLTIKLIQFADPKIKSFKMTRIDRGEYLKYHFENYFFRLPKLKDQMLNLLNVVYQLGYHQSNSLEKKIRKTKRIEEKNLLLFLDYFDNAFSKIKPVRDKIAHRGDLEDQNIAMLTSYTLIEYDKEVYNNLIKGQIAYTYIFRKNQSVLKQAVIMLLLVLNDEFIERLKSLKSE